MLYQKTSSSRYSLAKQQMSMYCIDYNVQDVWDYKICNQVIYFVLHAFVPSWLLKVVACSSHSRVKFNTSKSTLIWIASDTTSIKETNVTKTLQKQLSSTFQTCSASQLSLKAFCVNFNRLGSAKCMEDIKMLKM